MKFQLVDMPPVGAREFDDETSFKVACDAAGYTYQGVEEAPHLLPHLRGLPKYQQLHGPMGGDPDRVRYETWPASEMYSR